MPDRPKVRFQTKRDTGVYALRGGRGNRADDGVTLEDDHKPQLFKKD